MKLTGKKIKSMLLCMMLAMAMAITAVGCGDKTENTADTQKNTETAIVNTETTVETEAVAETECGCCRGAGDHIRRRQCQIYFYRGGCRWKRDKLCGQHR